MQCGFEPEVLLPDSNLSLRFTQLNLKRIQITKKYKAFPRGFAYVSDMRRRRQSHGRYMVLHSPMPVRCCPALAIWRFFKRLSALGRDRRVFQPKPNAYGKPYGRPHKFATPAVGFKT